MKRSSFILIFIALIIYRAEGQNSLGMPSGNIGIGTTSPTQPLDVRGQIYTTGSVVIDGGDLLLKRTSHDWGYILRPNTTAYKNLQFAVEGGFPLDNLFANSLLTTFYGKVEVGPTDPIKYGMVQLNRNSDQGDDKFHLSFIRNGYSVAGMGYARNSNVLGIWYNTSNQGVPLMAFNNTQKVGVGISDAWTKFHVNTESGNDGLTLSHNAGNFATFYSPSLPAGGMNQLSKSGDAGIVFGGGGNPDVADMGFVIGPWSNASAGLRVDKTGSVGIGTNAVVSGYKLAVSGGIITEKVKVKLQSAGWPDYVFEKDYSLMSLEQVERFINEHKHLPGMPSAKEVGENGLNLGENQAALLQKIEELTLYVIDQNKRLTELEQVKKDFEQLKLEVEKLKSIINK